MRSRLLLFFSLPNSSHHGLDFSIPCLPYSISRLHGRESKQFRLPPSGFSISAESLFSRNPTAASSRLHLGRRLSSPSILGRRLSSSSSACLNSSLKGGRFGFCFDAVRILNPRSWSFGCIPGWGLHLRDKQIFENETGNTDAVVQQFKEPEGGGRQIVPMVLDRLFSTSVLKLEFDSQSSVGSRIMDVSDVMILMVADVVDWMLQSVAAMTGKRQWLFWAWASHSQMWASVCEHASGIKPCPGMCWPTKVYGRAVEASGLEVLKIDYGPYRVMSIGYYYPSFS